MNFFLADVETGVGPFMATYFVSARHWNPAQIGLILAAQKITSVAAQVPAGWAIDQTKFKKWLMATTAFLIGVGALLIAVLKTVAAQIANQAMVGILTAIATPLVAAISLGVVGRQALGHRIGRNESFNHAGNLITASLAGYLGYVAGLKWMFYACGGLGLVCAGTTFLIHGEDIDDAMAREAPEDQAAGVTAAGFRDVLAKPFFIVFATAIVLFHIGNAAMLPLVGEELPHDSGHSSSIYMSACIVMSQLVMIPVAFASGRLADHIGRKPIFLVGFLALISRGLLFALSRNPNYLVGVEALDGIGTGISGVLTVLIVSDLAQGTGRFNFLQGTMQACLGLGSFLGNLVAGLSAKSFGFPATFVGLACVAIAGLVLLSLKMPETLHRESAERNLRAGTA
jgi:MFS family permease